MFHRSSGWLVAVFCGLLITSCVVSAPPGSTRLADSPGAINHAMNSVVALVERRSNGLSTPQCTAFFVGPRTLATANHCVERPQFQVIRLAPGLVFRLPLPNAEPTLGREILFIDYTDHLEFIRNFDATSEPTSHRAIVVQVNPERDVAILRLADDVPSAHFWFPIATLPPRVGEQVYEIGMPGNQFWLLTEGMVSSLREYPNGDSTIVHQAHVSPGASGGPLFNNQGQVIGVTTSFARNAYYIGFATPISEVQELMNRPQVRLGTPTVTRVTNVDAGMDASVLCEESSCLLPE